jgi:hypothetical protein
MMSLVDVRKALSIAGRNVKLNSAVWTGPRTNVSLIVIATYIWGTQYAV